jgi:hypothetical protein
MSGRKKRKGLDKSVMVAMLGLIGTLLVALLGMPFIQNWWDNQVNAINTPIPTTEIIQIVPSETLTIVSNFTPSLTLTDTPFTPPTLPPTFSPTPAAGVMTAQITYNYSNGKAPLHVTFKAFSSFVTYPDGGVETCEFKNVCAYTWDVRKDGAVILGPVSGGGEFSYTFSKGGDYTVVVYVCRGEACNFSAASVTVK